MSKLDTVTNGKGDRDRIGDRKKFGENYDQIDWKKRKNDNIKK